MRRFPAVHPVSMNVVGMTTGAVLLVAGSVLAGALRPAQPPLTPDEVTPHVDEGHLSAVDAWQGEASTVDQDSGQPSSRCWRVLFWQLRSGGSSSQCAPDGSRVLGWMTEGMTAVAPKSLGDELLALAT